MKYLAVWGFLFLAGCASFAEHYPDPDPQFLERVYAATSSLHSGGSASYIVWRKDGYGITAAHAFFKPNSIHISFNGSDRYPADLVGLDIVRDIGVFRTRSKKWPDSKKIIETDIARLGEIMYVICFPAHEPPFIPGRIFTISATVSIENSEYQHVIGFSFPPNTHLKGCSGGPIVNASGKIVGITQIAFLEDGIGYATSIQEAIRIAQKLIDSSKNP